MDRAHFNHFICFTSHAFAYKNPSIEHQSFMSASYTRYTIHQPGQPRAGGSVYVYGVRRGLFEHS
jgi:hypothetical protein